MKPLFAVGDRVRVRNGRLRDLPTGEAAESFDLVQGFGITLEVADVVLRPDNEWRYRLRVAMLAKTGYNPVEDILFHQAWLQRASPFRDI